MVIEGCCCLAKTLRKQDADIVYHFVSSTLTSCQESADLANLWGEYAVRIKQAVLGHLGTPNEGILLAVCKYMQTVVQIQSHSQRNSMAHDSEVLLQDRRNDYQ